MIPLGTGTRTPTFPFMTYAIVIANIVAFLQEVSAPNTDTFISSFALIPYDLTHNVVLARPSPAWPPETILTSMFMHASFLHIFFNMLFLVVFGPAMEYACGHVGYLIYYLLCGTVGALAQIAIDPGSHVPTIGASGAIAGVLGGYMMSFPTSSVGTLVPIGCFPLFLRLPAMLVIGLWAAVQFVHGWGAITTKTMSEQGSSVAYFAHIGGFASGVILLPLFRRSRGRGRRTWQ
ncbi:MAG: rhomboid family intramembrane serine protease [Vulcanimicrobiaceae bacterium]